MYVDQSMVGDASMTCCVCYEEFNTIRGASGADRPDNSIRCSNNHNTCMRCIANLTMPARGDRSEGFSGFVITCPMCRDVVPLDVFQVLCVMRNSVRGASQEFPCICMLEEWVSNEDSVSECPNHTPSVVFRTSDPDPNEPDPPRVNAPRRSARLSSRA
tara:strand:- start:165 stop:641 length:477 start_codon:yes stop_codon:yes gene_type:complete